MSFLVFVQVRFLQSSNLFRGEEKVGRRNNKKRRMGRRERKEREIEVRAAYKAPRNRSVPLFALHIIERRYGKEAAILYRKEVENESIFLNALEERKKQELESLRNRQWRKKCM